MNNVIAHHIDQELGTIIFKRNLRAKRLSIKIHSQRLEVNIPRGLTQTDGMKFVNSVRKKLIKKQLQAAKKSIIITVNSPLETLTFTVHVKKADRKDIFSSLKSGVLTIEYPKELDVIDGTTQQYFWNSINYFLRKEAKRILPFRTYELAEMHGFSYSEVKIQSSKTRWGSCNMKRIINLSFYLLILPQYLIDYVILHELCHTKEMNHSPKFWTLMDKVTNGNSNQLNRELKNYKIPNPL